MKSQAEKLSDQIRFYCFQKDTTGKKNLTRQAYFMSQKVKLKYLAQKMFSE